MPNGKKKRNRINNNKEKVDINNASNFAHPTPNSERTNNNRGGNQQGGGGQQQKP